MGLLWLNKEPQLLRLNDDISVITFDTTAFAYGPLTHLMGRCVFTRGKD